MRVLVTGGAGFIGSHVVDSLLACGHEPFVVDNLSTGSRENLPDDVPFFPLSICDHEALAAVFDRVRPHAVCHQAAQMSVSQSVREPIADADVNILGLLRVFDNAARVGVKRMIFASSGGTLYGDVFEPADEDFPLQPISPYGISKLAGERYLQYYARERNLQGVALRYANAYGPRQNPHGEAGVVGIFCKRMLAGEPVTISGDGRYVRDYVFGTDVARANVLALEAELPDQFTAFNIGTAIPTDVNELAASLRLHVQQWYKARGISGEVPACQHGDSRPGDLRSNIISSARAKQVLGWEATTSLDDGLRQTVPWFGEQPSSRVTPRPVQITSPSEGRLQLAVASSLRP